MELRFTDAELRLEPLIDEVRSDADGALVSFLGVVRDHARDALANRGLGDAPLFITPTPFNTLRWRIVARTPDGYLEGFDSLLLEEPDLGFRPYASDLNALEAAGDVPAVERLLWFSRGFVEASVVDDRLLIADLRMGQAPTFVFTHVAAARETSHWRTIQTELLPFSYDRKDVITALRRIWEPVD